MKKIIFILIAMCFSSVGICQTIIKDKISINGLVIGNSYTQQQLFNVLGTPTKTIFPSSDDEYQNSYTFYFGENRFYYIDGQFYGFKFLTPTFVVNNLIRVGDNISKIDQLGGIKKIDVDGIKLIDWRPSNSGVYEWASVWFYYNDAGIVTSILCFIRDL